MMEKKMNKTSSAAGLYLMLAHCGAISIAMIGSPAAAGRRLMARSDSTHLASPRASTRQAALTVQVPRLRPMATGRRRAGAVLWRAAKAERSPYTRK